MLKWLKLAGSLILGLLIVYGLYRVYASFKKRSNLQSKVVSYFLSAEETEALYTGFSFVAVLEFFDKNGNQLNLPKVYVDDDKKINGICYRFYEVGIGYPNIGKAVRSADSLAEPEILSVNVIDSRVIGGARAQYHCDLQDTARVGRALKLKAQMQADRQWQTHSEHGRKILFVLRSLLPDSLLHPERFSLLMSRNESLESDVGLSAGYLGNLKLTFATVGTFTATKRFLFFKLDGGFYVRKDITEVTYGSQLSGLQVDSPLLDLGPPKVALVFEEPDLIAVNRYIDLLVASSKFVYKDEEGQKTIDAYMREDFEQYLKGIHGKAIEHSKRLTQLFVRKYSLEEKVQVDLNFKVKAPEEKTAVGAGGSF